jgi:predicted transglutaminase-like cysteine proteinase
LPIRRRRDIIEFRNAAGSNLVRTIHLMLGLALATAGAARAADPLPAASTAAASPDVKMICRRDRETGSLVKSKKTCHTKEQWQYIDDFNQKFARDMVDDSRTKSGGN